MVQEIQRLNMQLQQQAQLTQQLQQQQQQFAASSSAAASSPPPPRYSYKPPALPIFNGTRTDGTTVDFWISSVERFFESTQLSSLEQVHHAAMHLRDNAGMWWDSVKNGVSTWAAMKVLLHERYRPIAASTVARDQLDVLKQRGSVSGYSDVFRTILNRIVGMDVTSIVHTYMKGLQPAVKAEVHRSSPTTLETAMLAAQKAEQLLMMTSPAFRNRAPHPGYNNFSGHHAASHSSAAASSSSAPMEISMMSSADSYVEQDYSLFYAALDRAASGVDVPEAVQSQLNAIQQTLSGMQRGHSGQFRPRGPPGTSAGSKLSPEERQKLFDSHKCFRCKEAGHIARNCPKK
jgi:hypothetical protein